MIAFQSLKMTCITGTYEVKTKFSICTAQLDLGNTQVACYKALQYKLNSPTNVRTDNNAMLEKLLHSLKGKLFVHRLWCKKSDMEHTTSSDWTI